ncbi:hypothetical protein Raf01_92450 [Rugosimonospora africana]|uniref:Holin-X, holin superfamily III n=2 Tax=Rugosimonospora africana TaxID=556532 RepID=A0A8J3VWR5_9ACTN|nr:hypothetical protein Raf01_92450 [Rugosimonospora africana]
MAKMSESPPAPAAATEAVGAHPDGNRPIESLNTAELIRRGSEQLSTLVRDELALARAEMIDKAGHAGKSAGLFGGAGVISLYGVFGLLTGCVLLLARVMPDWGAAMVIGALLLAIAGLMAITGRSQVKQVGAPVPEAAVDGARRDLSAVTSAVESRKNR